jgi:hypothetical protein
LIFRLTRPCAALLGQRFDPVEARSLRRNFIFVIKSFNGGHARNQIEDANTNRADGTPSAVNVLYNQIEDE